MYVRDLEVGCLVKCSGDQLFGVAALSKSHDQEDAVRQLIDMGINYHATVVRMPKHKSIYSGIYAAYKDNIGLYTGTVQLDYFYFGIKKQHIFLVDGSRVCLDGYSVRDLEKLE